MTTINSMLHNESAAQLTLMDLLGGADDDTGAHVAEDLVKGADSVSDTTPWCFCAGWLIW